MAWQTDFLVEATAGLVGVFAGVALALWTERRRHRAEEARQESRAAAEFGAIRHTVLSSVVKNTLEAKRVKTLLKASTDPYLLGVNLELAVWEASQDHFMRLAPIDDRIVLSRYFDHVRRLDRLLDFYREARADERFRALGSTPGDDGLVSNLADVSDDVRLEGVMMVTDYGDPTQKRLLGLIPAGPAEIPIKPPNASQG